MSYPINECLESFLPYLNCNLVSNKAFAYINTLLKILPLSSLAVLECRLDQNNPRVDLEINLLRKPSIKLPSKPLKHPEWQFLHDIYQEWINTNSSFAKKIEHIWLEFDILEFDVDDKSLSMPIPCFFFSLNKENFNQKTLIEISSRLLNCSLSSSFEANLKYCIDCLPIEAYVSYLGAMLSRSEKTIRIVSKIPSEQILNYLIAIGWSGSQETIRLLLSKTSAFTDSVYLSYDVGETVMPRIGIECYLSKQPKHESRWQLFLDYLVELNLCSLTKRHALLTWSGYYQKTRNNAFIGSSELNVFRRRISHIKIVCDSQNSLEAKAYLELCEISELLPKSRKFDYKVA